jgi:Glycosyl transferase family 2
MKIYAVMLARNEKNILGYSIYNALNIVGVDRILIGDNGSEDKTRQLLDQIARRDDRLAWTDLSGEYRQEELVNGLAQQAIADGADWILPLDADEFPTWEPHMMRLNLNTSTAAGYALDVHNFAPFRFVRRDTANSVANLIFRVRPVGSASDGFDMCLKGRISWLQATSPPKHLWRASRSLHIAKGNHGAAGVDGPIETPGDAVILHAPLRAFDCLSRRIENARRLPPGRPEGESWHLKRLFALSSEQALSQEWIANSTVLGEIGPPDRRVRMTADLRLRRRVKAAGRFVQATLARFE